MHYTLHLALVLNYFCLVDSDEKIVFGRWAKEGEFPSTVCIRGGSGGICGGILVTLDKVITSAHCVPDPDLYPKTNVTAGTLNCKEKDDIGQIAKMKTATLFEGYRPKSDGGFCHDIAIVEVEKPFTLSDTLKLMKISSTSYKEFKKSWDDIVAAKTPCNQVGWGKDESGLLSLEHLKTTPMVFWTDEECQKNATPGDDMTLFGEVCSQPLKSGEGFCGGDSGAPFYCGEYAFGIASANLRCGHDDPYFHLLFWHYLKFIGLTSEDPPSDGSSLYNPCKTIVLLLSFCLNLLKY